MEIFDFIVKKGLGKNTFLDNEYSKLIHEIFLKSDEEIETRWETYNLIIKEFFNVDDGKYFREIKYRLTDGENPNKVILDIMSRYNIGELTHMLWFLKKKVEEYEEDDFFKRFY